MSELEIDRLDATPVGASLLAIAEYLTLKY
jgi:hypothetical protein